MADIRIKDLTTTASSTASDDFIAVDGTTNGTRKLSAFSPTFGGNATVTGTLSSGGNLSVTSTSAQIILGQSSASQLTYLIRPAQAGGAIQMVQDSATVNRWLSLGRADNSGVYVESMRLNDAGVVSISATTASTTTSSGALVVSGGVGVAGSITLGGGVNIAGAASDPLPAGTSGLWTLSGSGLRINSAGYTFASLVGNSASTAAFTLNGTTASTSTSSGALVVSGGVGVAGAAFLGGNVTSAGTRGFVRYKSSNGSTASPVEDRIVGFSNTNDLLFEGGMYGVNSLSDNSAVWLRFKTLNTSGTAVTALTLDAAQKAEFAATIKTAAPAGGTAAEWKLGTVATVSPTSPNRTIEVDIGGTIYYIHAKTTNN